MAKSQYFFNTAKSISCIKEKKMHLTEESYECKELNGESYFNRDVKF